MSHPHPRHQQMPAAYPWVSPTPPRPETIVVHDHDVLSGRGVNIALHPGNERFRALVTTRYDQDYCNSYSTNEKRAVAEEIVAHIKALDPPGRFLRRPGRSKNSRGLEGPWEELTQQEVIKKACQALRDCNRADRSGYAATVEIPQDVLASADERTRSGLTNKQYAEQAAAAAAKLEHEAELQRAKRRLEDASAEASASAEEDAHWNKKPRAEHISPQDITTPTTAASTTGTLQDTSLMQSFDSSISSPTFHSHHPGAAFLPGNPDLQPPSPSGFQYGSNLDFQHDQSFGAEQAAETDPYPLHMSTEHATLEAQVDFESSPFHQQDDDDDDDDVDPRATFEDDDD